MISTLVREEDRGTSTSTSSGADNVEAGDMLALGLIVCCWTEWIIVCELTASDSLLDFCRFDAFAEFTSPYQQNFLKTWKGHTFPRESVGQWALVIWASTPPLLRRTARNMRYWLAGYLPCCLDIYYHHRHIMVLLALVMMVHIVWFNKILCRKSDCNNKYFKRQSAISIHWMGCKIQKL